MELGGTKNMLKEIIHDILQVDDVLFVVKSGGATSEIRSNGLEVRQHNQWVTVGDNEGPCHMHINSEMINSAEFITEQKPERTSFSVRFYNSKDERIMAAFFTKMYDENRQLKESRKNLFVSLEQKYGKRINFSKK